MTTKKEERIFITGTVSLVFVDTMEMARISSSDTPRRALCIRSKTKFPSVA